MHTTNCTTHSTTGYSPYYLVYGREPVLPVDELLGTDMSVVNKSHAQYANEWQNQMNEAYDIVRKNCSVRKEMEKKRWDAGRLLAPSEVGDRVLIQNKLERGGPGKLRSY